MPCVTQLPPASPHQWNDPLILRTARLRRSARNPSGMVSSLFRSLTLSSMPLWLTRLDCLNWSHSRTNGDEPRPHCDNWNQPPALLLSFFFGSPFLPFFLSFSLLFFDSQILLFFYLITYFTVCFFAQHLFHCFSF